MLRRFRIPRFEHPTVVFVAPEPVRRLLRALLPLRLILVPIVLLAATAGLFYPTWLQGRAYVEPDTVNYYYPALRTWAEWLKRGDLLLWTPATLSGFPLFAEGEVGMLYPPHALLLWLLPFDLAFVAIPALHVAIASFGGFLFCRRLTRDAVASVFGGLAFGCGGLMVAQIHHTDVHSGFAWLPWVFWAFEGARTASQPRRPFWLAGMTGFLVMQLLTVHPQVPLTTLFGLSIYAGVFCLAHPSSLWTRIAGVSESALWVVAGGGAAIALAAVQIVPLVEVGLHSQRTNGWDYARATEYSQSFWNLITAFFPLFYLDRVGLDWGFWVRWETPMYVGVVTLAFALVGLFVAPIGARIALAALAGIALWISFADYSPINLHWYLYQLPGFSVFRAPGRFVVLYDFAIAVLAAGGVAGLRRLAIQHRAWTLLIASVWVAVAVFMFLGLAFTRALLASDQRVGLALVRQTILAVRRGDPTVSADRILANLLDVLSPTNGRTGWSLAVLAISALLLMLWWHWPRRSIWPSLAVVLLAVDLVVVGVRYHNSAPIRELSAQSDTARYVIQNHGLDRVWSQNDLNTKALRLMPFNTATVGGDSSLESGFDAQFAASATELDNGLVDLWNVRYIVQRKGRFGPADVDFPGPAWYLRTLIDPDRPISRLAVKSPESQVAFRSPLGFPIHELRVASVLRFGAHVEQGQPVAIIRIENRDGEIVEVPVRAGHETAEWAANRPDVAATVRHNLPEIAFRYPNDPEQRFVSFGRIPLPADTEAVSLTVRAVDPEAVFFLHGLALAAADGRTWQIGRNDKLRYQRVAEDLEAVVYENLSVLPRAFMVTQTVEVKDGYEALDKMRAVEFDARTTALVEGFAPVLTGEQSTDGDSVKVEKYSETAVRIRTQSNGDRFLVLTDSMYPGWFASVDGVAARIWQTNALFRGVRLPAGSHVVEFWFVPSSVNLGAAISAASALGLIGYLLAALWHWWHFYFRRAWDWLDVRIPRTWKRGEDPEPLVDAGAIGASQRPE